MLVIAPALLAATWCVLPPADEFTRPAQAANSAAKSSADQPTDAQPLPNGLQRFNGMLVGRLLKRDVETGSFVVEVDAISRVWENSRAENPGSLVGRRAEISGVSGKFLDVLVVTRIGETLEFECRHNGEKLVFPGELLRKVAPYAPEDYPVLPSEPESEMDRFGRHEFGQSLLLAARLVESGVRFVTVLLEGWDTHQDNFNTLARQLLPQLDQGLAGLLDRLQDRGLLSTTSVLTVGEFRDGNIIPGLLATS